MTIHLIYPAEDIQKSPEIIGWNILNSLGKNTDERVIVHSWDSSYELHPSIGDMIIGHAHPYKKTIFRRSIMNPGWRKKILIQPFNYSLEQNGYLDEFIGDVDLFVAITAEYWIENLKRSPFSHFEKIIKPLNLAVDYDYFSNLIDDKSYKLRKDFLYVGNDHPGKNVRYLNQIASLDDVTIHWVGGVNRKYKNLIQHGKMNLNSDKFKQIAGVCRGHIVASCYDANPTTVLETAAMGLIQITADTAGYLDEKLRYKLTLDLETDLQLLRTISNLNEITICERLNEVNINLQKNYNWDLFRKNFWFLINLPSENAFPIGIKSKHVHSFLKMKFKSYLKKVLRKLC